MIVMLKYCFGLPQKQNKKSTICIAMILSYPRWVEVLIPPAGDPREMQMNCSGVR